MSYFKYLAALAALIIFAGTLPAMALADAGSFDFHGFKLGMTLEEARKAKPEILVDESKTANGFVAGYSAYFHGLTLRFTSPKLGSRLFFVQETKNYDTPQNPEPIYTYMRLKYGNPDYAGSGMFSVNAFWGSPYNKGKSLNFELTIKGVRKNFPLVITLKDADLEKKNLAVIKQAMGK
ncbi:MAG: hypothetical protein HZB29_02220 [Nitrospinae bacterium]|nr:hypothetical protein [Nitrospinota bacterium]